MWIKFLVDQHKFDPKFVKSVAGMSTVTAVLRAPGTVPENYLQMDSIDT